ncbi:hypothetical protein LTR86_008835 [Recurvomyces mirabilis]|nr:hypothetical protein LTR86_008835 [Recurvomyces mirabilis]
MTTIPPPASLLALPCELRNQIYLYIFAEQWATRDAANSSKGRPSEHTNALSLALQLDTKAETSSLSSDRRLSHFSILLTCHKLRTEAQLLALSHTPFDLPSDCSSPDIFALRTAHLSQPQLASLRHLSLTAKINPLRALNESWFGLPFGHPSLRLDKLTIVPQKPDCTTSCYAEIADLSQAHTLAYVLAETLKGLRNVKTLEVRNENCFNFSVWQVLYKGLILKLWRWGGVKCGVTFESLEDDREDWKGSDAAFRVYMDECHANGRGREVGDEIIRLAGGELPELETAGVGF